MIALPLPAGLPLDAASWEQTPLVVRPVVIQLLAGIQQQERMAALQARLSQNPHNSDRAPSSDPPWVKPKAAGGPKGTPGARPGHPGHRQPLLEPTEAIEVKPAACACGQTVCPDTSPFYTHQVIELPEFNMTVRHVVLHEACCPQCGKLIKAALPEEHRYGYGPQLTTLIGELSGSQRDSPSAVQEFCTSVLGVPISRGAIQCAVDRVSEAIRPHYEAIAEQARRVPVNSMDETA